MPITNQFTVEKKEGQTYPPLPEDVYQVQLLDITSEKRPTYDTRNKVASEQELEITMKFQFVLLEGMDKKIKLRGRSIWQNFVPTYLYVGKNGKNKLYQIIEALLGHELTQEEEAFLDSEAINKLIGSQCRIMTKQKKSDDKIYDNIVQYLKSNNNLTPLTDEEKEDAEVKEKKETETEVEEAEEVNVGDLPF